MAFALVAGSQAAGTVTDGGTLAFSGGGALVGSNTLLIACIHLPSSATVVGITDLLGNTWAAAVSKQGTGSGAGATINASIWFAYCATGGANQITCDWSGAASAQVNITEYSGFTGGVTAVHETNFSETTTTPVRGGSITTTDAGVVVCTISFGSVFSVTARSSGWNALTGGSRRDSQYYLAAAAGETTDGTVTCAANEASTGVIATFYTAVSAAQTPHHALTLGIGR